MDGKASKDHMMLAFNMIFADMKITETKEMPDIKFEAPGWEAPMTFEKLTAQKVDCVSSLNAFSDLDPAE